MANGIRRVAGLGFDGSTVTTTLGKSELKLTKASYGDKLEKGELSNMGSQQIDEITPGSYKIDELKLSMSSVEFRAKFMPAMPKNGFGNVKLPFVISHSHPELGDDSDLIEDCYCTNLAAAVEASNKAEEVEVIFKPRQIKWTHERKTINALKGAVPVGAIAF